MIDYGPGALQHLHTPHEMLHSIISHLLQLDRRCKLQTAPVQRCPEMIAISYCEMLNIHMYIHLNGKQKPLLNNINLQDVKSPCLFCCHSPEILQSGCICQNVDHGAIFANRCHHRRWMSINVVHDTEVICGTEECIDHHRQSVRQSATVARPPPSWLYHNMLSNGDRKIAINFNCA